MNELVQIKNKIRLTVPAAAKLTCIVHFQFENEWKPFSISGEQGNITTGVAIVNANKVKDVTLMFGCVADRMSEGGLG